MECHGGNGYAEDWGMARLYRQAPLNSIWEGSGNVICLDVIRAMAREPESIAAFMAEVGCRLRHLPSGAVLAHSNGYAWATGWQDIWQ